MTTMSASATTAKYPAISRDTPSARTIMAAAATNGSGQGTITDHSPVDNAGIAVMSTMRSATPP